MKIFINRSPIDGPWGGGNNFVKAFHKYLPQLGHKVYTNLVKDLDVIFIQDPKPDDIVKISINECILYKKKNPHVKLIQRINECDARKGTNDIDYLLKECSKYNDKTLFVSNWIKKYFQEKGWYCSNNDILINGVDKFYMQGSKINNEKLNIVTHHWSDNFMKGFDIYDFIDNLVGQRSDITFTYIGRHRGTFKNSNIVLPLFGKELADKLKIYDLYISGSRFDPGPNHIIESIACGIPTYSHSDGGGACEFTGQSHVFSNFDELIKIIEQKTHKKNDFIVKSWYNCIKELHENTLLKC